MGSGEADHPERKEEGRVRGRVRLRRLNCGVWTVYPPLEPDEPFSSLHLRIPGDHIQHPLPLTLYPSFRPFPPRPRHSDGLRYFGNLRRLQGVGATIL